MRRIAIIVLLSLVSLAVLAVSPASAGPSQATATPGALVFKNVPTGTTRTMIVTFTNQGKADLSFIGQAILPPGSTAYDFDFTFLASDHTSCPWLTVNNPPALPAGGSCTTAITFSPANRQVYRAFLSMNFGDSLGSITESLDVQLLGRGS
jgi:hypothetical protein